MPRPSWIWMGSWEKRCSPEVWLGPRCRWCRQWSLHVVAQERTEDPGRSRYRKMGRLWTLAKVCGPRTRNPHIHIYCHCYGDGHGNRHSHLQCCGNNLFSQQSTVFNQSCSWTHAPRLGSHSLNPPVRRTASRTHCMVYLWITETQESQEKQKNLIVIIDNK